LGIFFSEDPQNFKILPGERPEIFATGQAAVLLLELKNKELNSILNNNKRNPDEDMEENCKKKTRKASLSEFLSESFSRKESSRTCSAYMTIWKSLPIQTWSNADYVLN